MMRTTFFNIFNIKNFLKSTMKTLKKLILLALMYGFKILNPCFSQDIHLSQFWMAPLVQNPALAGVDHDLQAIVNYKDQWRSVAIPYKTGNVSFDLRLGKKKGGKGFSAAGMNIMNDKAGEMGTFQGNIAYAYHVYLNNRSTLGGGLYAGFAQHSINYATLQWGNQYDGMLYNTNIPSGEQVVLNSKNYFDMGGGVHWKYAKNEKYITGNDQRQFNAGIAAFHATQPAYSFYGTDEKLNMKFLGYANALIGIGNSDLSLAPGLIYSQQGNARELLIGSLFRYQLKEESKYTGLKNGAALSFGLHYRNQDAVIASMLLEVSQYSLGISYDINVSGLKTASNGRGGIEIALRFITPNPFNDRNASTKSRF